MLYNNISSCHPDFHILFFAEAQQRMFQAGSPYRLIREVLRKKLKDFAYQPPIVGLLADSSSRV
ncbi:hypothetical protein EMIT0232MI5_10214 [Pseudomonas sp. IT-232MI5]